MIIENEKILRHTKEMYAQYEEERLNEKKQKDEKRGPIVKTVFNSIGHP